MTLRHVPGRGGGGEGGPRPNLLVVSSSGSSSRKSRSNQLMVEGSLSCSLISGRVEPKSNMKSA